MLYPGYYLLGLPGLSVIHSPISPRPETQGRFRLDKGAKGSERDARELHKKAGRGTVQKLPKEQV